MSQSANSVNAASATQALGASSATIASSAAGVEAPHPASKHAYGTSPGGKVRSVPSRTTPAGAPSSSAATTTYVALRPEERAVIDAIRELPFGAVEVVVHQARIVQIVKTEKLRVESAL